MVSDSDRLAFIEKIDETMDYLNSLDGEKVRTLAFLCGISSKQNRLTIDELIEGACIEKLSEDNVRALLIQATKMGLIKRMVCYVPTFYGKAIMEAAATIGSNEHKDR